MSITTIRLHEFKNKNKVELVFEKGDYATVGSVMSFCVYFLEYCQGSYFGESEQDHHYMVCSSVHFPLTNFLEAVKAFNLYVKLFESCEVSYEEAWKNIEKIENMSLEEIKTFHDSYFDKIDKGELPEAVTNYS